MKRISVTFLSLLMFLFMTNMVSASEQIQIELDGQCVTFTDSSGQPFVDENDRTLVPFRQMFEAYGANVSWQPDTRVASAQIDQTRVEVPIGATYIWVNGEKQSIDTSAIIKDGRTYLPVRAVSEAMGASVLWNQQTRMVSINRPTITTAVLGHTDGDLGLGATRDALENAYGKPSSILPSLYGFDWWLYADDYNNYTQIGIANNKIVAIQAATDLNDFGYDLMGMSSKDISDTFGSPLRGVSYSGTLFIENCEFQTIHNMDGHYLMVHYRYDDPSRVSSYMIIEKSYQQGLMANRNQSETLENSMSIQVFHWTNVFRVSEGLSPLAWDSKVATAADKHAEDMADNNYFSHLGLDGSNLGDRLDREAIDYRMAGENLAAYQFTALEATEALMHSEGHRANILNPRFQFLGTATAIDSKKQPYYVQNFTAK